MRNITDFEIMEVVKDDKKLKTRKSPGEDRIPNEYIKYDCPKLPRNIKTVTQDLWKKRRYLMN